MKTTTVNYECDECNEQKQSLGDVFSWLSVKPLRDDIELSYNGLMRRFHFCSLECLAVWASKKRPHPVFGMGIEHDSED